MKFVTHLRLCCYELHQVLVEGEVRMSRKTLQELGQSSLSLVQELLTFLVKVPCQLLARERLNKQTNKQTIDVFSGFLLSHPRTCGP